MKRLSLILLLCASACVNLEKPRAYRCQSSNDCVEPWVCLRDNYCHDPGIGIDVACESAADCVGGWYCGKDGRCRDPERPSALVCDDDTQCGSGWFCSLEGVCRDRSVPGAFPCETDGNCSGGWRCNIERVCADVSGELSVPSPSPLVTTTRKSPLLPLATTIRPGPVQFSVDGFGVPVLLHQAVLETPDAGLHVAQLIIAFNGETLGVRQAVSPLALGGPVLDVEINGRWMMVLDAQHQLSLINAQTNVPIDAGARAWDIIPLLMATDAGSPLPAFAMKLLGKGGAYVVIPDTGEQFEIGKQPFIDLAYLDGVGDAARFAVVNEPDSAGASTVDLVPRVGTSTRAYVSDAGVVGAIRSKGLDLALRLDIGEGTFAAVTAVQSLKVGGLSMPRQSAPTLCPQNSLFSAFAVGSNASLDLACAVNGDNGLVWRREDGETALSPLREFTAAALGSINGGTVRQLTDGTLRFGDDLENDLASVLDGPPHGFGFYGDSLAALRGSALYVADQQTGDSLNQGLELAQFSVDAGATHVAAFIEGSRAWLWSNGLAISSTDGGVETFPWVFEGLPRLQQPSARVVRAREGEVFVASDGDALWAGAVADAGVTSLVRAVARPAPGFPVTSWIAGPTDAGVVEGWAMANNRLFKLNASSLERWRVTEVPVSGREALAVFFHGAAPRLGTTTGEVLSLPSRVLVAPAFSESVTSMESARGVVFASSDEGVFQLVNDAWEVIPQTRALKRPVLRKFEERVFVTSETGVVLELNE